MKLGIFNKSIINKSTITVFLAAVVIAWGLATNFKDISRFIYAESTTPTVQIKPVSLLSSTITVNFPSAVADGDIADFELNDSNNQKVWQRFSDIGSNTYTMTVSNLADGQYKLNVGLFKPNWSSNYAWYGNIATLALPNNGSDIGIVSPLANVTPSSTPSATVTPTTTPTTTPSPTAQVSQVSSLTLNAAMSAYSDWKARYVVSVDSQTSRVMRPENNNDTVSEGIGYGMLLSAYAKDQQTFDNLWRYGQKYLDSKGLMNWNINSGGGVIGTGSATDADEDMAYALIKANQVWPGSGYDTAAKKLITAMKATEVVANNHINPGDNWGNTQAMNPSYLAPSYYKAFASLTGDSQWNAIATANSDWLVRAANSNTGLLPDWLNADLSSANIGWDSHQQDFWYDAVRTPIRLLMSYKYDGDSNAAAILQKQSGFFNSVGQGKLVSGYTLSGSGLTSYIDSTFLSGYAAAGQVNQSSSYSQSSLNVLITNSPNGYYGTSLRALTLFVISN